MNTRHEPKGKVAHSLANQGPKQVESKPKTLPNEPHFAYN
jgi:hypothetical protein